MSFAKKIGMLGLVLGLLGIATGSYADPVNINKADAATLAKNINGVGPAKAQAIVTYRHKYGPFKSIHDLTKVKGIGEKLVAKNKPDLLLTDMAVKRHKK